MNKIAKRLMKLARTIVSFRYIQYEQKNKNVFFDGRTNPLYYVKKIQDNKYLVYFFDKKLLNTYTKYVRISYVNGILNQIKKSSDSLETYYPQFILKKEIMDTKELAVFMIKNLNMSNHDFENEFFDKIQNFEEQEDFKKYKYRDWQIILQSGVKDIEQVYKLLNEVENKCRKFSELLYGVVEVKKKLEGNTLADYSNNGDYMRIKADRADRDFVKSFIHELGHRLWYKFLNNNQRFQIQRKYYDMLRNEQQIELNKGDLIETKDGYVVQFIDKTPGRYRTMLINKPKRIRRFQIGDVIVFKNLNYQNIEKINHKKLQMEEFDFPTSYSKKNEKQFFSECFSYWMIGGLNKNLINFFESVL